MRDWAYTADMTASSRTLSDLVEQFHACLFTNDLTTFQQLVSTPEGRAALLDKEYSLLSSSISRQNMDFINAVIPLVDDEEMGWGASIAAMDGYPDILEHLLTVCPHAEDFLEDMVLVQTYSRAKWRAEEGVTDRAQHFERCFDVLVARLSSSVLDRHADFLHNEAHNYTTARFYFDDTIERVRQELAQRLRNGLANALNLLPPPQSKKERKL